MNQTEHASRPALTRGILAGDGILDAHHIFSQLAAVKYQYGCFFRTAWAVGTAVVPPPWPLGTPCPE